MALGKDNLSQSFSVLTQKQFDKFLRDYQILVFLNPELPASRVCHNCNQWDKDWPVIRRKGEENVISLRDALKVPNFANLDFDIVEDIRDGESLVKQIAPAAYAIRPLVDLEVPVPNSAVSESGAEARGSSGVQAVIDVLVINEDSDLEIRELDRELKGPSQAATSSDKGTGTSSGPDTKGLVHRKRKAGAHQINLKDELSFLKGLKKARKADSSSFDHVLTNLSEHISGGRSSR
ncbi:hypothetical protein Hanom_Chr10g00942611 [Helianthus anomalus]